MGSVAIVDSGALSCFAALRHKGTRTARPCPAPPPCFPPPAVIALTTKLQECVANLQPSAQF